MKYKNQKFRHINGLLKTLENKINPGVLLLIVALITIIVANSPLGEWYQSLWKTEIIVGTKDFNFFNTEGHPFTTLQFVNDALMAIFFFVVGLEIKREMLVGELASPKKALLPIIAACGGMILPVIVFYTTGMLHHLSAEELRGMAVPMATDIAFSVGVLSLLGKRVPTSLKIFLLALATVDDLGGIIVIAIFYSHFTATSVMYLLLAVFVIVLLITGNRLKINNKLFYVVLGVCVWYFFLQGGIHPTIAGVIVAFCVPARPRLNLHEFTTDLKGELDLLNATVLSHKITDENRMLTNEQIQHLSNIESASDVVISPLQDFEDNLGNFVNFLIMPLFAFANAGVILNLGETSLFTGITLSTLLGLFIGKGLGIFSFTWLSVKFKICRLSSEMNWTNMAALSILGGIGFTVALFLAGLSYPLGSDFLNEAKLGVIGGSFISGLVGYFALKIALKDKR